MVVRSNEVYAAGRFSTAGTNTAVHVAKWNGSTWSALPNAPWDTDAQFSAITANNSGIYVGGGAILRWNGTTWQNIGTPSLMVFNVSALCGLNNDLYAAGSMRIGINQSSIAKWNGSTWTSLMSGGSPLALTTKGSEVFVGGESLLVSGSTMPQTIARWNGSGWFALGSGLNGTVTSLAVLGNDLYAGGYFSGCIAKWNGTAWSSLGGGLNGPVNAIAAVGSTIYVAGTFTSAGGVACTNLAAWSGTSWSAVNAQMRGVPLALITNGPTLYVGGRIDSVNHQPVGNIFSYASGTAQPLSGGVKFAQVAALGTNGNDIFAGGMWRTIAGTNSPAIARFDGTNWHGLGSGLTYAFGDPAVEDIVVRSNSVYVTGRFTSAGGTAITNVARWNGTNWQALGTGLTNQNASHGTALAFYGNDLYVGGTFFSYNYLAKWNGTAWSKPGSFNASITSLEVFNNELYASGYFSSPHQYLTRWNGSAWNAVGAGAISGGPVLTMAVIGTNLYVGGWFYQIGTSNYSYIAKWNGSSWSALGTGLNGGVYSLKAVGNDLYVGGAFTSAGGITAKGVARWDGTNWHSLGSGFAAPELGYASAFLQLPNEVLIGGNFVSAGTNAYSYLASWRSKPLALQPQRSGSTFSLSWPSTLSKYTLQSASGLSSGWSNAPQTPALLNSTYTVVTNSSAEAQFFRLRKN